MRITLDQLVNCRDINMAIRDDNPNIDSVHTILNHNHNVINNQHFHDIRLQSLMW